MRKRIDDRIVATKISAMGIDVRVPVISLAISDGMAAQNTRDKT
jgi:hypothetical protein